MLKGMCRHALKDKIICRGCSKKKFFSYIFSMLLAAWEEAQSVVQLVFPSWLHTAILNLHTKNCFRGEYFYYRLLP